MNIEQLNIIKKEICKKYDEVKELHNNSLNKELSNEELEEIQKEINKIDNLISIYESDDINSIVMKLERLYMMSLTNLNEIEFNKLSDSELFNLFDKYFPEDWIFKYDINSKEKLLLDAIINNELIRINTEDSIDGGI